MTSTWSTFTRRVVTLLLLAMVLVVLWLARSVMTALLLSAFIAFLITPIVDRMQKRSGIPRFLGALVVLLVAFGVLALVIVILAPIVVAQFGEIRFEFAENLESVLEWVRSFLDNFRTFAGYDLNPYVDDLQAQLQVENLDRLAPSPDDLVGSGGSVLRAGTGVLATVATTVGGWIFTFVLIIVFTTYLVNDLPVLSKAVGDLIPEDEKPELEELKQDLRGVWFAFVRGNLVLMAALGFLVGASLFALGLPSALLLGLITGLLAIIPTVGAFIAGMLMVAMALFQGSMWLPVNNFFFALIVLGVYLVMQWLEGNVLQPKIMGAAVNLPGFISIVGILVGLAVGGILGAYLAIPFIASAREIFLYLHKKITRPPPAEETGGVVAAGAPGDVGWLSEDHSFSTVVTPSRAGASSAPHAPAVPSGVLLPEERMVTVDGTELYVADWTGPAPAVLGLHGLTANAHAFGGLAFALRSTHRTVAFDLRGRGRSAETPSSGLATHVSDAARLVEELGLGPCVLVGHSYGAMIALELALEAPESVSHLVLIDGGAPLSDEVVVELGRGLPELSRTAPDFVRYIEPVRESGIFEEWNFFIERFYRMDVEESPGLVRSRIDPRSVEVDLDDLTSYDPWSRLEGLAVPLLVLQAPFGLRGTGRPVLSEEDGRRLAQAAPEGRFMALGHTTHSSILYNRFREIAEAIEDFVGTSHDRGDNS